MSHAEHENTSRISDEFVLNMTNCQNQLYAYIFTLLPDPEIARDILQETNMIMWRKADQFQLGTSFSAWACKIAYFEVIAQRRRLGRDRHMFNQAMLDELATVAEQRISNLDQRVLALESCMERLHPQQRRMLLDRYRTGGSVKKMAVESGQTAGALAIALHRIRKMLMQCVESKMAKECN